MCVLPHVSPPHRDSARGRPLWARWGTAAAAERLPPSLAPPSSLLPPSSSSWSRSCIPLFSAPFTRREPPEREHRRSVTRVECPQVLEFKTMARISSLRITWTGKYRENSCAGLFFLLLLLWCRVDGPGFGGAGTDIKVTFPPTTLYIAPCGEFTRCPPPSLLPMSSPLSASGFSTSLKKQTPPRKRHEEGP